MRWQSRGENPETNVRDIGTRPLLVEGFRLSILLEEMRDKARCLDMVAIDTGLLLRETRTSYLCWLVVRIQRYRRIVLLTTGRILFLAPPGYNLEAIDEYL